MPPTGLPPSRLPTMLLTSGEFVSRCLGHMTELTTIEARLGTVQELPNDLEKARDLAHTIANQLTAIRLQRSVAAL